jgi:hypothetical protein
MSNQIPGVPEGWELVHANRAVKPGEHFIDRAGNVVHWGAEEESAAVYPIVRKIEKPAKYRPFEDAREADQFWNASLRLAGVTGDAKDSRFRITSIGRDGITTNAEFYSYEAAFYKFYVDDDGTPFGVRIDE